MTRIPLLIMAALTIASAINTQALAENQFSLPASEDGLPGEGSLRRYDAYVK